MRQKRRRRRSAAKRTWWIVAIVAAAAVAVPVVGAVRSGGPAAVHARLALGSTEFWDGEHVDSSRGAMQAGIAYLSPGDSADDPCRGGAIHCRDYRVEVTAEGGTLRVGIDVSKRGECYGLELRDPKGRRPGPQGSSGTGVVCSERFGLQAYDLELSVPNADPGTWRLRVIGMDVEDWAYRLRARLEAPRTPATGVLAPNLVPWLPWEFGFVAPSSPRAGQEIDRRNPPGPVGVSCHPEEAPASKCLRFSAGVHVTGDGPLYLAFRDNRAFQHVYRADATPDEYSDNEQAGLFDERPAGGAEYHPSHGHRHFAEMMLYELFAVDDVARGELRPLGTGHKHGFCTVPQQLADWSSFAHDSQHSAAADGYKGLCDSWMALSRGWGDTYRWQRTGQFLPYDDVADPDGTMKAGMYLVRVTVDPDNLLLETNDDDNVAYALIRVVDGGTPHSDRVTVCERGFGAGPWDAGKKKADPIPFLWAERIRDPAYSPATCPPGP